MCPGLLAAASVGAELAGATTRGDTAWASHHKPGDMELPGAERILGPSVLQRHADPH